MDLADWEASQSALAERASQAQAKAAQAYARLLDFASADTGQGARVRRFIAATCDWGQVKFDLFDLRALDVERSDDVLICIDALRWGRADLYKLVPQGLERVQALLDEWGLDKPPAVDPRA